MATRTRRSSSSPSKRDGGGATSAAAVFAWQLNHARNDEDDEDALSNDSNDSIERDVAELWKMPADGAKISRKTQDLQIARKYGLASATKSNAVKASTSAEEDILDVINSLFKPWKGMPSHLDIASWQAKESASNQRVFRGFRKQPYRIAQVMLLKKSIAYGIEQIYSYYIISILSNNIPKPAMLVTEQKAFELMNRDRADLFGRDFHTGLVVCKNSVNKNMCSLVLCPFCVQRKTSKKMAYHLNEHIEESEKDRTLPVMRSKSPDRVPMTTRRWKEKFALEGKNQQPKGSFLNRPAWRHECNDNEDFKTLTVNPVLTAIPFKSGSLLSIARSFQADETDNDDTSNNSPTNDLFSTNRLSNGVHSNHFSSSSKANTFKDHIDVCTPNEVQNAQAIELYRQQIQNLSNVIFCGPLSDYNSYASSSVATLPRDWQIFTAEDASSYDDKMLQDISKRTAVRLEAKYESAADGSASESGESFDGDRSDNELDVRSLMPPPPSPMIGAVALTAAGKFSDLDSRPDAKKSKCLMFKSAWHFESVEEKRLRLESGGYLNGVKAGGVKKKKAKPAKEAPKAVLPVPGSSRSRHLSNSRIEIASPTSDNSKRTTSSASAQLPDALKSLPGPMSMSSSASYTESDSFSLSNISSTSGKRSRKRRPTNYTNKRRKKYFKNEYERKKKDRLN